MEVMDKLVAILVPIFVVVILPVSIVLINSLTGKAKYDKKISFFEKCVENGVEINPDLVEDNQKKVSLKTTLLNKLSTGIIMLLIGVGLLIWNLLSPIDDIFTLGAFALIAVGVGMLVWFVIGKRMLEDEIKAEQELLSKHEEN